MLDFEVGAGVVASFGEHTTQLADVSEDGAVSHTATLEAPSSLVETFGQLAQVAINAHGEGKQWLVVGIEEESSLATNLAAQETPEEGVGEYLATINPELREAVLAGFEFKTASNGILAAHAVIGRAKEEAESKSAVLVLGNDITAHTFTRDEEAPEIYHPDSQAAYRLGDIFFRVPGSEDWRHGLETYNTMYSTAALPRHVGSDLPRTLNFQKFGGRAGEGIFRMASMLQAFGNVDLVIVCSPIDEFVESVDPYIQQIRANIKSKPGSHHYPTYPNIELMQVGPQEQQKLIFEGAPDVIREARTR